MFSASETGRPELAGMQRAHTLGQGTGFESPFGIYYAPAEVNQIIQNNRLEEMFRGLAEQAMPGEVYHLSTLTTVHPDGLRLKEVRYLVERSERGGPRDLLFEYVITVGNNPPHPTVTHGVAKVTSRNEMAEHFVNVPERLRDRFAGRRDRGDGAVEQARNWTTVQRLIGQSVATAALPPGYIRSQRPDGQWVIRRTVANDAELQRLTVRTLADGVQVIAVWRP